MYTLYWASQLVLVVKNLPANAGVIKDVRERPRRRRLEGYSAQVSVELDAVEATQHGCTYFVLVLNIHLYINGN